MRRPLSRPSLDRLVFGAEHILIDVAVLDDQRRDVVRVLDGVAQPDLAGKTLTEDARSLAGRKVGPSRAAAASCRKRGGGGVGVRGFSKEAGERHLQLGG